MNEDGLRPPEEVLNYYNEIDEGSRLSAPRRALELLRMQEIITRTIPKPPSVILDVGGGTGVYSRWLAAKGYAVHLIDPVSKHINEAKEAEKKSPSPLASAVVGDARRLEFSSGFAEVVLLMGPLYHLTDKKERLLALSEARRVLKPGGVVIVKAISRFSSLLSGLLTGEMDNPYFAQIIERDLKTGQHLNPSGDVEFFTTAYLHKPDELRDEVTKVGFSVQDVLAVQGPGELTHDLVSRLQDEKRRGQLFVFIRTVEREPSIIGISRHFVVTAVR
jgi:ubiquinone/menaquinone biosynthesis C-methylase UbiE